MTKNKSLIFKITFLVMFLRSLPIFGEEKCSLFIEKDLPINTISQIFTINFPIGSNRIESNSAENESTFYLMKEMLAQIRNPLSAFRLDSIVITGSASPLGDEKLNRELSQKRAEALATYFKESLQIADSLLVLRSTGANWRGLYEMVAASSMLYKKEVLEVIDCLSVDQKRNKVLMELKWGRPYLEMMETFFPKLQFASTVILYGRQVLDAPKAILLPEPISLRETRVIALKEDITAETKLIQHKASEKLPLLNISSNVLYLGVLAPNIGVEYCFPKGRWSVNSEIVQAWWSKKSEHKYYQIRQFSAEPRIWLKGSRDFRGHFFGAYGNAGIYDLENGRSGYKGDFWGVGVTYGYVLKLRYRFRLEFSLGFGILNTTYEKYIPADTHYVYEKRVNTGFVGPTKAKMGLVWTIFQRSNPGNK